MTEAPKRWTWKEMSVNYPKTPELVFLSEKYFYANEEYIDHLEAENKELKEELGKKIHWINLDGSEARVFTMREIEKRMRAEETITILKEALEYYEKKTHHWCIVNSMGEPQNLDAGFIARINLKKAFLEDHK